MQNDKTVDDLIPANRFISRLPEWLIVGISFVSIITGLVVLVSSTSSGPAIVNLVVAMSALVAALLTVGRKLRRSSVVALLILIAVIAVIGVFSSLLFRDDYSGGSCGEFDWPSGHLHAGYPYSWLDGQICVPPHTSLSVYAHQHPEEAGWYPDFPALFIDLLFWINAGILVSSILGVATDMQRRMKRRV